MSHTKLVNGVVIDCTEEDETELKVLADAWDAGANDRKKDGLRQTRKPLLEADDYAIFTLEDAGSSTSSWKTYRQALRDITDGDLDDPSWPTKPS